MCIRDRWRSKWSELNFGGFWKWWSRTSPSNRQTTWLNSCAWWTKTARFFRRWPWADTSVATYQTGVGGGIQSVAVTKRAIIICCLSFCWWTVNIIILSVLTWLSEPLYNISHINLRLWWMYHLCGCEASPSWSLACSLGCIIPSASYVFLTSALNILFLAQTPLLYLLYFNTLLFLKLVCFL